MKLLLSLSLAVSASLPANAQDQLVDIQCYDDYDDVSFEVEAVSPPTFVPGSSVMIIQSPESKGAVLLNVWNRCLVHPTGDLNNGKEQQGQGAGTS